MIKDGYKNKLIRLINNPNDGCVAAQIGEHWFYFAGSENEEMTVKEYEAEYTFNEIVDYIFSALNSGFKKDFEDEYNYYYCYLKENNKQKTIAWETTVCSKRWVKGETK